NLNEIAIVEHGVIHFRQTTIGTPKPGTRSMTSHERLGGIRPEKWIVFVDELCVQKALFFEPLQVRLNGGRPNPPFQDIVFLVLKGILEHVLKGGLVAYPAGIGL